MIIKKIFVLFLYVLFLCLVLEIISRTEWSIRRDVPFFSPATYFYYPELKDVEAESIKKNDSPFDILLLGGSVMTEEWGSIAKLLEERIAYATKKRVRVHNLAKSAQTTLDSYYKYRHLMEKSFDLVIMYHGINDVRLNNCPPSVYKEDYSHYAWYKVINFFEKHPGLGNVASLYSLYYRFIRIQEKIGSPPKYISRKMPFKKWLQYGNHIKTATAFKQNIEKILDIAKQKGEPVLLMSFCYYVPPDYSLEGFTKRKIDYTLFGAPTEIWGISKNVVRGIDVHNDIIRAFAGYSDKIAYVDQKASFPRRGEYFNDICHLTQKGCERFVEGIFPRVLDIAQEAATMNKGTKP
ncbi:MAG: SGNH/GDSL hydrolase family protein [Deltaproteobacteria bacterium]|nr:SGNH/GDSL hydrolase family protein [Deltaproteobacteria bacterium]